VKVLRGGWLLALLVAASAALAVYTPAPRAQGGTYYVPGDYPSIAAAVSLAPEGSTIIVRPGVYEEGAILVTKNLTIRSEAGPGSTVLRNTGFGLGANNIRIEGFTFEVTPVNNTPVILDRIRFPAAAANIKGYCRWEIVGNVFRADLQSAQSLPQVTIEGSFWVNLFGFSCAKTETVTQGSTVSFVTTSRAYVAVVNNTFSLVVRSPPPQGFIQPGLPMGPLAAVVISPGPNDLTEVVVAGNTIEFSLPQLIQYSHIYGVYVGLAVDLGSNMSSSLVVSGNTVRISGPQNAYIVYGIAHSFPGDNGWLPRAAVTGNTVEITGTTASAGIVGIGIYQALNATIAGNRVVLPGAGSTGIALGTASYVGVPTWSGTAGFTGTPVVYGNSVSAFKGVALELDGGGRGMPLYVAGNTISATVALEVYEPYTSLFSVHVFNNTIAPLYALLNMTHSPPPPYGFFSSRVYIYFNDILSRPTYMALVNGSSPSGYVGGLMSPTGLDYMYRGRQYNNVLGNYYAWLSLQDTNGDGIADGASVPSGSPLLYDDTAPLVEPRANYVLNISAPTTATPTTTTTPAQTTTTATTPTATAAQPQTVTVTVTTQVPSPVPVPQPTTVTVVSERTAYTAVTYTSPYPVTVYSTATAREVVTQERTVLQPTPVPVVITLTQPTTITAAGGGAELLLPAALGALVVGLAIGYALSLLRRK